MAKGRANGEGSIFPYRNGYAAYVWVSTPGGERKRKYVYGKTRDQVHGKWLELHNKAKRGPVATKSPTLAAYLTYWLNEVVEPNLAPKTAENYATFARLYISPALGNKRLDKLSVRDVQTWFNKLQKTCQCCAQGKDARRDPDAKDKRKRPRCCAIGKCCHQTLSDWTARDVWMTLRAALSNAVREELVARNVAALVRVGQPHAQKVKPWSVEEARRFLESAKEDQDPFYAAYVAVLALGLRKGEVLGIPVNAVDVDASELDVSWQLQRVRGELLHRETKTRSSRAVLPLPGMATAAFTARMEDRRTAEEVAGDEWQDSGLLFTTRRGTAIEPRNFNRSFTTRCAKANVRRVPVHATRKTCASLLVALGIHPRVVMQILRHSQIAVTMNVYSEAASEDTKTALQRLGDQLGP